VTFVDIHVLNGVSPSSLSLTLELLETANRLCAEDGGAEPFRIALSGSGAEAAQGFLGADYPRQHGTAPDLLVLPSLRPVGRGVSEARFYEDDALVARQRLLRAAAAGAQVATSCTGVFLLASTGLLDERRATTSWWLATMFQRHFPKVRLQPNASVVIDGAMATAGAPLAQLDLMLSLVARHAGGALAERCSRRLLMTENSSPARFMAPSFLASSDERVAMAERWAMERLDESFAIDDLAGAAGLTARTFARRLRRATGLSPVRFVQQLRVRRALDLLRTTRLPFDEIARRVGYSEPSTLRRLFRREGAAGAREIRGGLAAVA
jgi:transcriptional regulator GlxA family with amidase domain